MTTPLIEAIARAMEGVSWGIDGPDFPAFAQAALTAITEAGYQLTRVLDEEESQRIMARSVVEYQASTAISAAQGDVA